MDRPETQFKDPAEYSPADWLLVEQARNAGQQAPLIPTDEWLEYEAAIREQTGVGEASSDDEDEQKPLEEMSVAEHLAAVQARNQPG